MFWLECMALQSILSLCYGIPCASLKFAFGQSNGKFEILYPHCGLINTKLNN